MHGIQRFGLWNRSASYSGLNMLVTAHKSGKVIVMPMGIPAGEPYDDTNPASMPIFGFGIECPKSFLPLSYFGGVL